MDVRQYGVSFSNMEIGKRRLKREDSQTHGMADKFG
jgi:hypothetical protein